MIKQETIERAKKVANVAAVILGHLRENECSIDDAQAALNIVSEAVQHERMVSVPPPANWYYSLPQGTAGGTGGSTI